MPVLTKRQRTHVGYDRPRVRPVFGPKRKPAGWRSRQLGRYAPDKKKMFMYKRAPFTETKRRTSEEVAIKFDGAATPNGGTPRNTMVKVYIPVDDAFTNIELSPCTFMTQGPDETDMNGRSVYAKYLTTKIELTWPKVHWRIPADVYIVHGFIKLSPNLTPFTTPSLSDMTYEKFRLWIAEHIKHYFDAREDRLRFIPKQDSTVSISGYRKVAPAQNKQIAVQPMVDSGDNIIGSVPTTTLSIEHRMMKKLHYEKANNNTDPQLFFLNMNQWIPFACLYTPNYADNPAGAQDNLIGMRSNTIMYYSDS